VNFLFKVFQLGLRYNFLLRLVLLLFLIGDVLPYVLLCFRHLDRHGRFLIKFKFDLLDALYQRGILVPTGYSRTFIDDGFFFYESVCHSAQDLDHRPHVHWESIHQVDLQPEGLGRHFYFDRHSPLFPVWQLFVKVHVWECLFQVVDLVQLAK